MAECFNSTFFVLEFYFLISTVQIMDLITESA